MLDASTADVLGLLYMRLWELPIVIVMSCCIGALGSLFIHLNTTIVYKIRNRLIPHHSRYRCPTHWPYCCHPSASCASCS